MGSGPLLSSFEILECPTDTVLTAQILHNFTRLFRVASSFLEQVAPHVGQNSQRSEKNQRSENSKRSENSQRSENSLKSDLKR